MWSGSGGVLSTGSGSGGNKSASTVAASYRGRILLVTLVGVMSQVLLWSHYVVDDVPPISWPDGRECQS